MLTVERLKELLSYDPETGVWTWLISPRQNVAVGSPAGYLQNGYRVITIDRKPYRAARLAFLYMTGILPAIFIDHENLNRSDDRWSNLREASRSANGANRPINKNNTSGFKGVSWHRSAGKWGARIRVCGRSRRLGLFSTPEAAHAAYIVAADLHFGEFARAA